MVCSQLGLLVVEEAVVDVGPELSQYKGGGVEADIQRPVIGGVGEGALWCRVVEIRDACGGSGADDFADIEGLFAGVGTRNDGATEGVSCAFEEAAVAEGVVAGIFMRGYGNEEFDHVVFDGLIDGGVPEIAAKANAAGTELRNTVATIAITGEKRRDDR